MQAAADTWRMAAAAERTIDDLVRELETVAREQGGGRVTRIRVRIGPPSPLTPEHFREQFAEAARGTLAEEAEVQAEAVAGPAAPGTQGLFLETIELELE